MTLEEMEAVGKRANAIRAARQRLDSAQRNLDLLNKLGQSNWSWKTRVQLRKPSSRYANDEIAVEVVVPFGVVQQQLIYAVQACRRDLAQLER